MKKLMLITALLMSHGLANAEQQVALMGAEYLEAGEEIFHRMDTSEISEGDIVTVVDKRNSAYTLKAEAKKVTEKSLILKILPRN